MQQLTVSNNGNYFTAYKLTKHLAVETQNDWVRYVGQPGDFLIVDEFFNTAVYKPRDFFLHFKVVQAEPAKEAK